MQIRSFVSKPVLAVSTAVGLITASSMSWAALTVDYSSAITDVGTAAAAIVGVVVVIKAAQYVIGMLKRT